MVVLLSSGSVKVLKNTKIQEVYYLTDNSSLLLNCWKITNGGKKNTNEKINGIDKLEKINLKYKVRRILLYPNKLKFELGIKEIKLIDIGSISPSITKMDLIKSLSKN